jgi:radical SAM-linked protein
MKSQRLRFRFRLTEDALGLRHRDLIQAWESAVKGAGLPLSYSSGKRSAPQISLAAPLPQGVTSDCEVVDVLLESPADPAAALSGVSAKLPPGIEPYTVTEEGTGSQSLQAALRWAEYEADVPGDGLTEAEVRQRIECLLAKKSVPAEYRRDTRVRAYDLRPLILSIDVARTADGFRLRMMLRAEQENTARADQVVLALGLPAPSRIHRTRLGFVTVPPVITAYRRLGGRED